MKRVALLLIAGALWLGLNSEADAQIPYVTYYQPTTVYSVPVAAPAPPCAVPQVTYYAPAVQPVAYYRTRYRPFLGGSVTRVRYGYAPAPVFVAY